MRSLLFFLGFFVCAPVLSAPITLKCTDSSGQPAADLIVDTSANRITWGIIPFRINQQSDRYITAQEIVPSSRVGGETWVLDRVTGHYTRAGVAILASKFSGPTPVDPKVQAYTYMGTCNAPVF